MVYFGTMATNLRSRLARIRGAETLSGKEKPGVQGEQGPAGEGPVDGAFEKAGGDGLDCWFRRLSPDWEEAGYRTLRRTQSFPLAITLPEVLPPALPLLLPDLAGQTGGGSYGEPSAPAGILPENLLLFDLETTGLSGGAGTVAFLAAFGKFQRISTQMYGNTKAREKRAGSGGFGRLEITQFLLLDYPGESCFIDEVLTFFQKCDPALPFLTTYNGKSFDTPLLKTRCLMNGREPPSLPQLDLLHPARRMWKRVLPNCSQATVESGILGLDRGGDISGALAPDIWFDFLRSGGEEAASGRLAGICDHNLKDIAGLAALFTAFTAVAEDPLEGIKRYRCDAENLALLWRRAGRPGSGFFLDQDDDETALLEEAARQYPRSCLRLAFDRLREGRCEEGRAALRRLAGEGREESWRVPPGLTLQVLALRALAVDAERRLKNPEAARRYCEKALEAARNAPYPQPRGPYQTSSPVVLPRGLRDDLEKRLKRLSGPPDNISRELDT